VEVLGVGEGAAQTAAGTANGTGEEKKVFDEQVQALDAITGQPLRGMAYYAREKSGKEHKGATDDEGRFPRIVTEGEQLLEVLWGIAALEKIDGLAPDA
jgi:hypothetical protein